MQVTAIFSQYQQAAAAGQVPEDVARRMDGALLSIGALSDILKSKVCCRFVVRSLLECGTDSSDGNDGSDKS